MEKARAPEKIGRYSVEREIGRGGMGVVYLAHDPFIDRAVAVKVSFLPSSDSPEGFKEARAAGKLTHPHIVSVFDAALEKDCTRRYANCRELALDLSVSFDHLKHVDETINFEEKFNVLKKIKFFRDFSYSELEEVLKSTKWFKYDAGSTVIAEGEMEDCFYIIISGEVRMKKHGRALAVLRQGDCFGEMAHLGGTRRTATIEALKNTILMRVNTSIIDLTPMPTQLLFYKIFSQNLIKRLSQTSERLSEGTRRS